MTTKSEMKVCKVPGEYATSLNGEVADEIHEWPNATLGPEFRHLTLQFRDDQLIHIVWKFNGAAPVTSKPWWKFW